MLLHLHEVCHDEAGRTEGRVATGDGSSHNTQQSQDATCNAKPAVAHLFHHGGSIEVLHQRLSTVCLRDEGLHRFGVHHLAPATIVEEIHGDCCPDEGYKSLGDHGSIEDAASPTLRLHATCHERALRGMEAADGTAGNSDEEAREYGVVGNERLASEPSGILVEVGLRKVAPQFRNNGLLDEESHQECQCHKDEREGKERIYLANDLVDRQHRGNDVIGEDHNNPE